MNKLTISQKLLLSVVFSILGLLALLLNMNLSLSKQELLKETQTTLVLLESDILMLRKNEKDFIIKKDIKYKKIFANNIKKLKKDIDFLDSELKELGLDNADLIKFEKIIKNYNKLFNTYVDKQVQIGLNSDLGLYKSLRDSVHKVQKEIKALNDKNLLAMVYDLRKNEKDFMLRKDLKYIEKYKSILEQIQTIPLSDIKRKYLTNYKNDFLKLVENEVEMGLSSKLGIHGDMRRSIHKTEEVLNSMNKKLNSEIISITSTDKTLTYLITFVIILIVMVIAFLISFYIRRDIQNFKNGILDFFSFLNKEKENTTLLEINSQDEIGQMSLLVNENIKKLEKNIKEDNNFIEEVVSMVQEVNTGKLSKRFENEISSQNLEKLRINMNLMLEKLNDIIGKDTNNVLNVLNSYSNLDFTNNIENDKGTIPTSLNNVNHLISSMLVENKHNGSILEKSSNELMMNVETLSVSTDQAAVSLEQTASSLEEITVNIINNTENVGKMTSYAHQLSTSANEGENLAQETTSSMDKINEQVNSINDAITVIDQIAFQTNILSLNAAVEAATAGEAGKGFAVVAQEVRNLASRSAEAAKEIKTLVENATCKADEGKEIAAKMINGYNGLNNNINKTLDLISHVQTASTEQKSGIEQINQAINELEKQTQQNASVANETKCIAVETLDISKTILSNANKKKFLEN